MGSRNNRIKCPDPDCGSVDVIVVETRYMVCGSRVRRRRCECCKKLWHTIQPPEREVLAEAGASCSTTTSRIARKRQNIKN